MNKLTKKTPEGAMLIDVDVLQVPTMEGKKGLVMLNEKKYQEAVTKLALYEELNYNPSELRQLVGWANKLAALSASAKTLNLTIEPEPVQAQAIPQMQPSQPVPIQQRAVEPNSNDATDVRTLGFSPISLLVLEQNNILTVGDLRKYTLVQLREITKGTAFEANPEGFTFEIDSVLKMRLGLALSW